VHLHHPARILSVSADLRGELSSVRILSVPTGTETDLPCTRLILTAGAWTPSVFAALFPASPLSIPVTPLAGHSLVVRSPRWHATAHRDSDCHAVFTTDPGGFSPEIFSRVGGEIYVAGLNSDAIPLPARATDALVDDAAIARLRAVAAKLLGLPGREEELEVVRQGLCFRPVTPTGRPIVARVDDALLGGGMATRGGGEGGVFLSAGHGPWGISLSLGTGKVLAELVEGKATSASLRGLELGGAG